MASSAAKEAALNWGELVATEEEEPTVQQAEGAVFRAISAGEAPLRLGMAAFSELFHEHGARMKSVAANLLGSQADAEDAVQDTFVKVYRGAAGFRGGASPMTWVYRILVNTCYDQMRRSNRRAEDPLPPRLELELETGGGDHPLRMALEAELGRLPQKERAAFLLCEVEGFSHREAGEILEVPEATSRTFLFRAKRRLQQALRAGEASVGGEGADVPGGGSRTTSSSSEAP